MWLSEGLIIGCTIMNILLFLFNLIMAWRNDRFIDKVIASLGVHHAM
jgi:hypothetical protein